MNYLVTWLQSWTSNGKYAILIFPIIVFFLFYASLKITKYSEMIKFKTKISSSFIGGALIGIVTSIPELITEITQSNAGTPENGLGNNIGSNSFSIFLIAVGAIIFIKNKFINKLKNWTKIFILISFLSSLLLSIFLIFGEDVNLKKIGIIPIIFFLIYLLTIFLMYKYGDDDVIEKNILIKKYSLKKIIFFFVFWSIFIVIFSILLNINVSAFQKGSGIKTDSIGGIFLAIATSLPEIIIFFSFVKRKKYSIGISSIIGSHFFNLSILFFGDITYTSGPTFLKSNMQSHLPLAILTSFMLLLLLIHVFFSKKFPKKFKNKKTYSIIPSIIITSYIVGWILILLFN